MIIIQQTTTTTTKNHLQLIELSGSVSKITSHLLGKLKQTMPPLLVHTQPLLTPSTPTLVAAPFLCPLPQNQPIPLLTLSTPKPCCYAV